MAFNQQCADNLAKIITATQADIVLTTTHRIHYDDKRWRELLQSRGITTTSVSKVNRASTFAELSIRCKEVVNWVAANLNENFVIIDDDKSLRDLPVHIKDKWVETNFYQGLTDLGSEQAIDILLNKR